MVRAVTQAQKLHGSPDTKELDFASHPPIGDPR
jgi:hypothetical protein